MKGIVKRKSFSPPPGASPERWCFLLVETDGGDFVTLRLSYSQVSLIMVGDRIRFRKPLLAKSSIRVRLLVRP